MKIIISNNLQIIEAPEAMLWKIRDTFTLRNPAWIANKKWADGTVEAWI